MHRLYSSIGPVFSLVVAFINYADFLEKYMTTYTLIIRSQLYVALDKHGYDSHSLQTPTLTDRDEKIICRMPLCREHKQTHVVGLCAQQYPVSTS